MKIVIDIDDDIYKSVVNNDDYVLEEDVDWILLENAIANGIPLPKGHGRLIDADDIALIDEQFYVPSDYYVAESAINDAPTIIEADKEVTADDT